MVLSLLSRVLSKKFKLSQLSYVVINFRHLLRPYTVTKLCIHLLYSLKRFKIFNYLNMKANFNIHWSECITIIFTPCTFSKIPTFVFFLLDFGLEHFLLFEKEIIIKILLIQKKNNIISCCVFVCVNMCFCSKFFLWQL